jgi:hypothetical protein
MAIKFALQIKIGDKKRAAQPGQFGTDNEIVFSNGFKQRPEAAFFRGLRAAGRLLYPVPYPQTVLKAKPLDFITLVFHRLPVRADPDIAVYHASSS